MKTTILIVLTIATITVPCLAQEIEPEGLFWVHGTVWRKIGVGKSYIDNLGELYGIDRGFYAGQVYKLLYENEWCVNNGSYLDFLTVSFYELDSSNSIFGNSLYSIKEEGILFPLIGIGFVRVEEFELECSGIRECYESWYDPYYILLIKINNWWNPSRDCPNLMSR